MKNIGGTFYKKSFLYITELKEHLQFYPNNKFDYLWTDVFLTGPLEDGNRDVFLSTVRGRRIDIQIYDILIDKLII